MAVVRLLLRGRKMCRCLLYMTVLIPLILYVSIKQSSTVYLIKQQTTFRAKDFVSNGPTVILRKHKSAKILIWTSYFNSKWKHPKSISTTKGNKCFVTTDKGSLETADVILFHLVNIITSHTLFRLKRTEQLPAYRRSDQLWVLHNMEPNIHVVGDLQKLNNKFNATWTFIKESEVYAPYESFRRVHGSSVRAVDDVDHYVVNSKRGAVALISNCFDTSLRLEMLEELRHYLPVRVLGYCGEACEYERCEEQTEFYAVYAALENSQCRDYVTEKYWRAVHQGQLPVVAWLYNMSGIVIPHSYINILDFPNIHEAATYIQQVIHNKTLYNSYFQWKNKFMIYRRNSWNDLCDYATSPELVYRTYHDMSGWLTNNTCEKMTVMGYIKSVLRRTLFYIGL